MLATARSGDLFAPAALHAVRSLAQALAEIEGVEGVRSMFDVRREGVAGAVLPVIPRVDGQLEESQIAAARTRAATGATYGAPRTIPSTTSGKKTSIDTPNHPSWCANATLA